MNKPAYYSQFGEDKWIVENLNPRNHGIFCEVGAYDGIISSNTRHFEQLGWEGICIEADPFNAAKCIQNRACHVVSCAVGPKELAAFSFTAEDRGIGGLKRTFGSKFVVPVIPLVAILRRFSMYELDLLSIDTEGTELEVWGTIETVRPRIVIMEHFTQGLITDEALILSTMERDGYKLVHKTDCNTIFLHQ